MSQPTNIPSSDTSTAASWLCLILFATLSSAPFLAWPWTGGPVLVAIVVTLLARRSSDATFQFGVVVSSLLMLLAHPLGWDLWPGPLLVTLVAYLILARANLLGEDPMPKRGHLDRRSFSLTIIIVVVSAVALLTWWIVFNPDLSDASSKIPDLPVVALVGAGLVFALANAIGEEFIWRGVGTRALEKLDMPSAGVIAIQSLSFGLVHIHGFPRGWIGVGLATVYGAMLGGLRYVSGGLLAPWIAHVVADLVIFAVLVVLAQR